MAIQKRKERESPLTEQPKSRRKVISQDDESNTIVKREDDEDEEVLILIGFSDRNANLFA